MTTQTVVERTRRLDYGLTEPLDWFQLRAMLWEACEDRRHRRRARRQHDRQTSPQVPAGARRAHRRARDLPARPRGREPASAASAVLDEMGVWDKVEAADFPIKVGGDLPLGEEPGALGLRVPARRSVSSSRTSRGPGSIRGSGRGVAFQVDRAIYDKILLDHAAELGARSARRRGRRGRRDGRPRDGSPSATAARAA